MRKPHGREGEKYGKGFFEKRDQENVPVPQKRDAFDLKGGRWRFPLWAMASAVDLPRGIRVEACACGLEGLHTRFA